MPTEPPFGTFPWILRAAGLASRPTPQPSPPCVSHSFVLNLDRGESAAKCKICGQRLEAGD